MKQIIKTMWLRGGDKATLEYEQQTHYRMHHQLGSSFPVPIVESITESYKIVIDYLYNPIEFDIFVFRDSPESWRKPIAICPFVDRELRRGLLGDFHVENDGPFYYSSIDDMCEQAKRRLGFWIEDRVNFELAQMKA